MLVRIVVSIFVSVFYPEFIDPLFKKYTGRNIIGTINPCGEVQRNIFISGHVPCHTGFDTTDNIEPSAVCACMDIVWNFGLGMDEEVYQEI